MNAFTGPTYEEFMRQTQEEEAKKAQPAPGRTYTGPTYEQFNQQLSPDQRPKLPEPKDRSLQYWENAPAGEVFQGFKEQFLPSVGRAIAAIPQAILNPSETLGALKQAGSGAVSKVQGAFGAVQDPEQKAQTEAVFNAIIEPFTSVGGFKKALATDPYSVLSVAAIPVSGGASALGRGAQAVGTATAAGRVLSGAETLGKITAGAMDPIYGATKVAGALASGVGVPAASKASSTLSEVPEAAYSVAFEAGKAQDPVIKSAFNTYAKGQGRAEDFSRAVSAASRKMRDAEMTAWAADKANALSLKQVVPAQPILDAIAEARSTIGPRSTSFGPSLKAHTYLDDLETRLAKIFTQPTTSPARTVEGFDQLKRNLYQIGEETTGMTSQAVKKVNAGVRQAMANVSPEYVKLMEKYQEIDDRLRTIRKSLNTGDNVSAVRELNSFIKAQDDVQKGRFIGDLAQYDPRIPYMVAGASIHQAAGTPSKWSTILTGGQLANIGWALSSMNPYHIAAAIAGLGASSPKLTSEIARTSGAIAGAAERVPSVVTAPAAAGARLAPEIIQEAQEGVAQQKTPAKPRMSDREILEEIERFTRPQRKAGGRVMSAQHMVAAADRAKKAISGKTEALLKSSDETVAKALEIAKQNLEG